ncbi:MAG: 5'-nucleotidase [Myxococcota bacterium]|jgi:5'-nucleotidase
MPIPLPGPPDDSRGVFATRTINLRAIKAIGYDMDYTLVHYHVDVWERRAYEYARDRVAKRGLPVGDLEFDPTLVSRGLILDTELGNIVKADRFGYVRAASHGTRMLEWGELRTHYRRTLIDLRDKRWLFLSTLFDISGTTLFAQCVDRFDRGQLPDVLGYMDLLERIHAGLDAAHLEGRLKAEIIADPGRYVDLDPLAAQALLDQRAAGKKLMLITNSEWHYTNAMMHFAYDPYLPEGMVWRELFDLILVRARKPSFFEDANPLYEIVDEERGLLLPIIGAPKLGGIYLGGHAGQVEEALGVSDSDILYVGDHIFSDVNVTKRNVGWRTALILRELEEEVDAVASFRAVEEELRTMMAEKTEMERQMSVLRLDLMRRRAQSPGPLLDATQAEVERQLAETRTGLVALDQTIAPLAEQAGKLRNPRWGLIMRAGIDKSHLARQIERFADVYTSRVSNFVYATPNVYLRAPKSNLPHD